MWRSNVRGKTVRGLFLSVALVTVFCSCAERSLAQAAATSTTLVVTSGGSAVTTINSGTVATLTASVVAGSSAVKTGLVSFCDASAPYCAGTNLLGTGQLTSAGTATLSFIPGIGSHNYAAVFAGTTVYAASTSAVASLAVAGFYPTTTSISQRDSVGSYTLSGTVVGAGGAISPTGTVSFVDKSNGNAVLGTAVLGSGSTDLSFASRSHSATGKNPAAVAIGDFNKDGILDLAVADAGNGTVTILLGKGNGTFKQAANSPIAVGNNPWSVAVGDFNGDGIPDLAVANFVDNTVSILLGVGDGTFTTGSLVTVGNAPNAVVAGDFNGDGKADLAVVNSYDSTITILLGNGDGTFKAASSSPIPVPYAYSLAVGDFNGDGIQDLAAVCNGSDIEILLGNGDGSFNVSYLSWVSPSVSNVVVGDFNGDGVSDLAVANVMSNNIISSWATATELLP